ncbi:unnamed protein product, partial [Sphagnum troendelagicum]
GLLSKGAKTKGILETSPRVRVSIATRWGITPRIAPSPNPTSPRVPVSIATRWGITPRIAPSPNPGLLTTS